VDAATIRQRPSSFSHTRMNLRAWLPPGPSVAAARHDHDGAVIDTGEVAHFDSRELLALARLRPVRIHNPRFQLLAIDDGVVGEMLLKEPGVRSKLRLAQALFQLHDLLD
jgi:hypothetical protein